MAHEAILGFCKGEMNKSGAAGSTQEELSSIVEASVRESKISGNDREVAWDGATMGGQDLQNQVCPLTCCPLS